MAKSCWHLLVVSYAWQLLIVSYAYI